MADELPDFFSQARYGENTGVRFATLMRLLCERNGGSGGSRSGRAMSTSPKRHSAAAASRRRGQAGMGSVQGSS